MALVPVLSFLLLLVFGSVDSWAGLESRRCYGDGNCGAPCGTCTLGGSNYTIYDMYHVGQDIILFGKYNCRITGVLGNSTCGLGYYCSQSYVSANCCIPNACSDGKVFDDRVDVCACVDPPPPPVDTTWHCQNAGGPVNGGFGGPYVAKIFRCAPDSPQGGELVCENTRDLAGSCQDWGYCEDGQSDCSIDTDKYGKPPCSRSGPTFTTSPRCYYACGDKSDLSCKPVSTQYVAGAVNAGECPASPPDGCRPASSSSGASSSSSGGLSSSAMPSPDSWRDTVPASPGSAPPEIDYTRILAAIHDTLHHANEQRDWQLQLDNNISLDLDNISNYTEYIYNTESSIGSGVSGINSKLSSFQENGFSLVSETAQDISNSRALLAEINAYLHSDSLRDWGGDTTYNPLLRDIKGAIDSINVNVTVDGDSSGASVDSSLLRWVADYAQDSAAQRGILGKIWDNIKDNRDSVLSRDCTGFNGCLAVYKQIDYCRQAWGVSTSDCVDGGGPFDNILNVEGSILSTVWGAVWGDDSTELSPVAPLDTAPLPRTPAEDSARNSIKSANDSIDLPSIGRTLDSMRARIDSVKTKKDSVKIDVDSTMMDSSKAARYVQHILLPSGTGTDCFVCHADLGTFGGLAPDGLAIHIDFSSFGGYNWCDLGRAIVKIMTLVVCISLTLGSWAAAFGYSPKNDA